MEKILPKEVQEAISENNRVIAFIDDYRAKNEYNPIALDEFNAKFNKEFTHFLNNGGFTDETIKFFTN